MEIAIAEHVFSLKNRLFEKQYTGGKQPPRSLRALRQTQVSNTQSQGEWSPSKLAQLPKASGAKLQQ
jgi:hypothetical protein